MDRAERPSAHDHRAGERAVAARRRRFARRGGTGRRAHAMDSGAAGRRCGARHARPVRRLRSPRRSPWTPQACCRLPPEQDVPAARSREEPDRAGAERRGRSRPRRNSARWSAPTFPRFYLQGAAYARGTGAEINGRILGGLNGLAPNVQNYALGFTVTFPVSDLPSHSGPGGRANGDHPLAAGPVRADRRSTCGPSGIAPSRC